MSGIEIKNASVSYFLRVKGRKKRKLDRAAVGAQIVVRQRYVEIEALKNVSLSMKTGERVGLIGINGSGKSTLLKLCSGALAVHTGSVAIDGKVNAQFSLGAGIKPTLSGRRNVELKCLYMGTPQRSIAERVEQVKELSGLGGYFELPTSSYSAGMRSRLVMSMWQLVRADILIMDEWIGAADRTVNRTADRLQRELIESASLVLLASHSERIMKQWATKLVWLDAGKVVASGDVDEVYPDYVKFVSKA
jgi:ABC-2 type transport system ATP-binding protein/lipopolysaccharide transport system ATP-binding protein